jgi:nucleotide-binding universal stress UspA family protein
MFRNILVSVDGSEHAKQALTEAIDMATAMRGRLTIMTAVPRPSAWAFSGPASAGAAESVVAQLEQEFEGILREAADRVPAQVPLTTILTHDPIRPAVLARIDDADHDLVVMGSRGRGAVKSSLLGSVSHAVLHHSPVPVLIVHAHGERAEAFAPQEEPEAALAA